MMQRKTQLSALAFTATLFAVTGASAVTYEPNVTGINNFTFVDRITWKDSKGLDRELFFAKDYPNSVVPKIAGYVTRLSWQPDAVTARIVAEEDPAAINTSATQGWGTNVMHMHFSQYGGVHPYFPNETGFSATTTKRDGFNFNQAPIFFGPHHMIFRVTYGQYTSLVKNGVDDRKSVNVTIDWFITDGLDHAIYAITIDATPGFASDPASFRNNTLAPYSFMAPASWKNTFDWAGGSDGPDGQSFGDMRTFITNNMANWTYGGTNTIPFVWQWVTPTSGRGNAEAAFIQTQTFAQHPAGEGFAQGNPAAGTHMPVYPDLQGQEYA
ncbi:MAG: hypothetical protein IT381_00355 [Deltaproteobacteria bacterium]|nr:hypothetical protein [Deltaproteobacteria bacterium]